MPFYPQWTPTACWQNTSTCYLPDRWLFATPGSPVCLILLIIFALSSLILHCPPVQHYPNLPQVYNLYRITAVFYMEEPYDKPARPIVTRTMTKISTYESKISMTSGFWDCVMHTWIPWQWAEQTCHQKLQVYKPRITWEAKTRSSGAGVLWKKSQGRHVPVEYLSVL